MTDQDNFDQLLDFSQPFNPELFDALVAKTKMNDSNAVITLTLFKNDEQNFMTIEIILNKCQLKESQLISLNILENLIDKKYFTFSAEIRQSFENTILHFVKEKSQANDLLLNKFNQIFVKLVLKNHYNTKSENLIISLIEMSHADMTQAINIFSIFTLLLQEILLNTHPTTIKATYLNNLKNDTPRILSFANTVLEKGQGMEKPLIGNALSFLTVFFESLISYEENGCDIFNTSDDITKEKAAIAVQADAIQFLVENMLSLLQSEHTTQSIRSLYTIIKYLQSDDDSSNSMIFTVIRAKFRDFLNLYFGKYQNSKKIFVNSYPEMSEDEKMFLLEASHLLSVLYEPSFQNANNLSSSGSNSPNSVHYEGGNSDSAVFWLASLPDLNLFKILLPVLPLTEESFRLVLSRFPRPSEVLITELDGKIIREKISGTESIEFSNEMIKCLYFYINYNKQSIEIFFELLEQIDETKSGQLENDFFSKDANKSDESDKNAVFTFDHRLLNSMCWSIGSVNPLLKEQDHLFVAILRNLLNLCECKNKKEEKAIIASGIMFIVGKHFLFLKSNKKFLKTVIDKLFEFCREEFSGIKDMACETFYMICERLTYSDFIQASKCKNLYNRSNYNDGQQSLSSSSNDTPNYIDVTISSLPVLINQLMPYQQQIIFESILLIIEKRQLFEDLKQQIGQSDPIFHIKISTLIMEKYLRLFGQSEFINGLNNEIMNIYLTSHTSSSNTQLKEAILDHFRVYFSINESESIDTCFKFYKQFGNDALSVLTAFFNLLKKDDQITHLLNNNRELATEMVDIVKNCQSFKMIDWLQFVQAVMNNFILQSALISDLSPENNDSETAKTTFLDHLITALQSSSQSENETAIVILSDIYDLINNHHILNFPHDQIIENIFALICDKDKEGILVNLSDLMLKIIRIVSYQQGVTHLTELLTALMDNFPNLNNYKPIIIQSLLEIKESRQFLDQLYDFRMFVWTYYEGDGMEEMELLKWRKM